GPISLAAAAVYAEAGTDRSLQPVRMTRFPSEADQLCASRRLWMYSCVAAGTSPWDTACAADAAGAATRANAQGASMASDEQWTARILPVYDDQSTASSASRKSFSFNISSMNRKPLISKGTTS